jgi:hypothetical protein
VPVALGTNLYPRTCPTLMPSHCVPSSSSWLPFMPQLLQTLGIALKRLPDLTKDMLDQERRRSISTVPAAGRTLPANLNKCPKTIVSTLIRLSDQEKEQTEGQTAILSKEKRPITGGSSRSNSYLTENEIAGNLFIFTATGFDTTTNTMSYAITLLAAYLEWQTWI